MTSSMTSIVTHDPVIFPFNWRFALSDEIDDCPGFRCNDDTNEVTGCPEIDRKLLARRRSDNSSRTRYCRHLPSPLS
jgi:hypothetical protein